MLVIGTGGGLLWRAWHLGDQEALTLAPAERLDLLVDLTDLADGERLMLLNSAPAPFDGQPAPPLNQLYAEGDPAGLNPYPWAMRVDIDHHAHPKGAEPELFTATAAAVLNPAFARLSHQPEEAESSEDPALFELPDHDHRTIVLAENPPGHLYLHQIVEDPAGKIHIQFPGETSPRTYRVENWSPTDPAPSSSRVSFYDRIPLRPQAGRWQVWRFLNATGDTHPMHIHQSEFQPLGSAGTVLTVTDANGSNLYDPQTRATTAPLVPDPVTPPRAFEPAEVHGWKDVIRVDPGNVVEVAVRFDLPGRFVYHCHILEHEDTEMMAPFTVTVADMSDGGRMPM